MKKTVAALILLLAQAESSYAQCFFCSAEKKSFLAACLKSEPAATYDICACVWEAESKLYNADERALITAYLAGDEETKANYIKKTELRGPKNWKRRPRPLAPRLRRRVVQSGKWGSHRSHHCSAGSS